MSEIGPNIIDPAKGPPVPPPDAPGDDHVGSDEIREPGEGEAPIEPDPEDGGNRVPDDIERQREG